LAGFGANKASLLGKDFKFTKILLLVENDPERLKIYRGQPHVGSSPTSGTISFSSVLNGLGFFPGLPIA